MAETTSKWQRRVARWRASGETAEVFSAREGFAASTLRWWSSKLARERVGAASVEMVQLVRRPLAAPPPVGGLVDPRESGSGRRREELAHDGAAR